MMLQFSNSMRTAVALTAALLFSTTILSAQTALKTNAILQTVNQINSDAGYTTKTLNTEDFLDPKSGQSGQLIGYFKNGQLIKMHVRIAFPTCIRADKYYLQGGNLILFYRQERAFQYNEDTKTYDASHPTTALECRYYFNDNKLIKTDSKGDPKCSEKPSEQQATEAQATCKKYSTLLKR